MAEFDSICKYLVMHSAMHDSCLLCHLHSVSYIGTSEHQEDT